MFHRPRWLWFATPLVILTMPAAAHAWTNLLADPGFESYEVDETSGRYVLPEDSPWYEYGFGRGAVAFDASEWKAPEAMIRQQAVGFSPGTVAYQGPAPEEISGSLTMIQDVVNPEGFAPGKKYEAWVWLGGAGADDGDCGGGPDADEFGGWSIAFYGSENPAEWDDMDPIEVHEAEMDFPGEAKSFVRLSRFGTIPQAARGFRFRTYASTWFPPAGPKSGTDARVALDNAHFGIIEATNLLTNGNFEMDQRPGELRGWQRPAAFEFPKNGQPILKIINVYNVLPNWGHNFDNGPFLPYHGGRMAYGYETYMLGWMDDAFNFSQVVDFPYPDGTPLTFMCYWMQNVNNPSMGYQLREHGSQLEFVFRYLQGDRILGTERLLAQWPSPSDPGNQCRYDSNAWMAHNPRYRLVPPVGTEQIEVNINCMIHLNYQEGLALVSYAVDDFWLSAAEPVE